MSKRATDTEPGPLVPVPKRVRSEVVAYAAKYNRPVTRTSSLMSPIMLLTGHEGEIFSSKFSPQGDILASAGYDRRILLWNVYGECENWAMLTGHGGAILEIDFSSDGTELVTCSTDKSVIVWDLGACVRVRKMKGHKNYVNCVSVAKNAPFIASGSDDGTVKLWDRRQRNSSMEFDNKYQILAVEFNQSAEQIFFAGIDNEIKVWETRMNKILYKLVGHMDSPTGLELSPDGNYLASNGMDSTVRIWDVRPYAPENRCVDILMGHTHNFEKNLLRVAWSPDGERIGAGSADKFVYVWERTSGQIIYRLPGHTGSVNEIDFHPFEPIISSCSSDKQIYLGEIL